MIHEANKTIKELRLALPKGFVFVLDTTDRSFLYKSSDYKEFEYKIINIDVDFGIDRLTRETGYHINNHNGDLIGLRNIGINTYVGFCLPNTSLLDNNNKLLAESIISN